MTTSLKMKQKQFKHLFVDSIPATLQDGVLYVCIKHHIVSHLCACGCGQRIDTPIDPDEWRLTYDGESISLWPSIGNYDIPCHSHYFITSNNAVPVGPQPHHKKKKKKRWWLFGLFWPVSISLAEFESSFRQYCQITFNCIIMSKTTKYVEHARNAKNGQYVSIAYAKKHPNTTVIERDKVK